jgi:hypothetical protein
MLMNDPWNAEYRLLNSSWPGILLKFQDIRESSVPDSRKSFLRQKYSRPGRAYFLQAKLLPAGRSLKVVTNEK